MPSVDSGPDARTIKYVAIIAGLIGVLAAAQARDANALRPHVTTVDGFYGFYDQGSYLAILGRLAEWRLPVGRGYSYGLGYPAVGVVFYKLGFRGDPFAPVDVLAFGAVVGLTVVLGTRAALLVVRKYALVVGLAAAALLMFGTPVRSLAATPWNTNIVIPLGLVVLVLITSPREIRAGRAAAIGICLGWIFATRYVDALFFALPVIAALFVRSARDRRNLMLVGGLALAAVVGVVLYTQYHAFGNAFTTPYEHHLRTGLGTDQSLSNYRLSWIPGHFWGAFVTGTVGSVRQHGDPILLRFPLLPIAASGFVVLIGLTRDRVRVVWLTAAIASGIATVFYLSFVAGGAADLKFGNERYWAVWYPLWTVLIVLGVAGLLQYVTNRGQHRLPTEPEPAHPPAQWSRPIGYARPGRLREEGL
jgi:hypothetical protein